MVLTTCAIALLSLISSPTGSPLPANEAEELWARFEAHVQEPHAVRITFVGRVIEVDSEGPRRKGYWGAYEAGVGGHQFGRTDQEFGRPYWPGRQQKSPKQPAPPKNFPISPITRTGFIDRALYQFLDPNPQTTGALLARDRGVLPWKFSDFARWRLDKFRFEVPAGHKAISGSQVVAYRVHPGEGASFDVWLWIETRTLRPVQRVVRISHAETLYEATERYNDFSRRTFEDPFNPEVWSEESRWASSKAHCCIIEGALSLRGDDEWQPATSVHFSGANADPRDYIYRADKRTLLLFNDNGRVLLDAGTEFTMTYRRVFSLRTGRISIEGGEIHAGGVQFGNRTIAGWHGTAGRARLVATEDRVISERGSVYVEYPEGTLPDADLLEPVGFRHAKQRLAVLPEGVEYRFVEGKLVKQRARTVAAAPARLTADRVLISIDPGDPRSADALHRGEIVDGEHGRVFASVTSTVPGQDESVFNIQLNKLNTIPAQDRLSLRYRYFIDGPGQLHTNATAAPPRLVRTWSTFSYPVRPASEMRYPLHLRCEQPFYLGRIEVVQVPREFDAVFRN